MTYMCAMMAGRATRWAVLGWWARDATFALIRATAWLAIAATGLMVWLAIVFAFGHSQTAAGERVS